MKLKVVHVEWLDSTAVASWDDPKEIESLSLSHSVGFVVKQTKNSLVLALSFDPETKTINPHIQIPLKAIVRKKILCTIQT